MMTRIELHIARTGATAIAAALALSSTSLSAAPKPIVDLSKSPAESGESAPASAAPRHADETLPIMGGGALVLLVGGAVAIAAVRRRREREPVLGYELSAQPEERRTRPVDEQPAIIPPHASAFAWGRPGDAGDAEASRASDRPRESWVERAYQGPSADNPSLSLRKRLKRAAFFDKREREAAQGTAEPLKADAGLPELALSATNRRELEAA
jgi:hypothetical protein